MAGSRIEQSYNRCCYFQTTLCCAECEKAIKCIHCCPTALPAAKKKAERREQKQKRDAEEQQRQMEIKKQNTDKLWSRFKSMREKAGVSLDEVAKLVSKISYYSLTDKAIEAAENRDREAAPWYWRESPPEASVGFRFCYEAAKLFGCPVEALTDPNWTPSNGDTGIESAITVATPMESPATSAKTGELWWRPFPRMTPPEGQRALVVQEAMLERFLFEAKLAQWHEGSWFWVADDPRLSSIQVERVTHWFPEPAFRDFPEEADDGEEE